MDETKLKKIVNSSGFPLQIGLEFNIKNSPKRHGWRVLFSEHSWANFNSDAGGFIDLVLEHQHGGILLIVECKRVQNTNWIFLQADTEIIKRRHAKASLAEEENGKLVRFGWNDIAIDPATVESNFCVVPGQDNKTKPMLERVAAEVVQSTEGFAIEDQSFHKGIEKYRRHYLSVIVTTADLMVCNFDPSRIGISNGELDEAHFTKVPYLRFRKQLSTYDMPAASWKESDAHAISRHKENTVFVVNSDAFIDFLYELTN